MTSDRLILRFAVVLIATITLFGARQEIVVAQDIPSPEEFFGFEMGADRKLARWDKLVEYYEILGRESDRLRFSRRPGSRRVLDLSPMDQRPGHA